MIVRLQRGDTRCSLIYFYSSSISLSYFKHPKQEENKTRNHTSVYKFDEDSFDCLLNI